MKLYNFYENITCEQRSIIQNSIEHCKQSCAQWELGRQDELNEFKHDSIQWQTSNAIFLNGFFFFRKENENWENTPALTQSTALFVSYELRTWADVHCQNIENAEVLGACCACYCLHLSNAFASHRKCIFMLAPFQSVDLNDAFIWSFICVCLWVCLWVDVRMRIFFKRTAPSVHHSFKTMKSASIIWIHSIRFQCQKLFTLMVRVFREQSVSRAKPKILTKWPNFFPSSFIWPTPMCPMYSCW